MYNLDSPFCDNCNSPLWALYVGNIEMALDLWHGMTSATRREIADEISLTMQSMSNIYQWCNGTIWRTFDIDKLPGEMKVRSVRCKSRPLKHVLGWWELPYNKKEELSGSNNNTLNLYFRGTWFKIRLVNLFHRTNLQLGHTHFIRNLFQIIFNNFSTDSENLKVKATGSSETSGTTYPATQRPHPRKSESSVLK